MSKQTNIFMKTNFELIGTVEAIYTGGSVQLSSNGSSLFCSCGDSINEIDVITGKSITEFNDDGDEITSLAVSPDNKILITASRSLILHKFSVHEKIFLDRWKAAHKTPILSMVFDQSSTLLATGSSDSTVKVYDTIKKYCTHNFKGAESSVNLVMFHPQPNKLILFSAYNDGKIRMWDLKTSKCLCVFEGHFSAVTSLIFSSDNLLMVSAGRDKVLIVWDLLQRKQTRTVPVYECIEDLSMVPNKIKSKEECFVTVGETGYLRMWSLPNGQCIYADKRYREVAEGISGDSSSLTHLFYSHTIDQLIAITYDHNIIFYDVKSLKSKKQFIGYYDEIVDIKFFGADQKFIAVATNSEEIKIIYRESTTSDILHGHSSIVLSLDVSYDSKYIASSSKDNTIRVWCKDDTGEFCCVAIGKGHTHHVGCVSWPKTSTDYLVSCGKDYTIKCWLLPQLLLRTETVELQVKWTEKAHDKDINAVAISPNDKLVVSASQDKTAKVWKFKSGNLYGVLNGHKRGIWCAEFSPVDQCIATGSVDATIKLWALSNFTCVKTFEGHMSVLRVFFINRGMQLVSSGSEGLIKVWNIRNDECVTTIEGHDDRVWAMAVSKSENIIVTGGADSTIKFWQDITEQTIQKQEKEEETKIKKEQEMMNLIQDKKFDKAVELAIMLNHPHRAFKAFKQILVEPMGQNILQEVIHGLPNEYLECLLMYLCDWNTNVRNSFISQSILSMVLRTRLTDDILELPKIKEIIESLLPYTERHYDRVNRLVQQSMFVNYSWESMKLPIVELSDESAMADSHSIE